MASKLSVINPLPRRLPGPEHLQKLVAGPSKNVAIGYHDFKNNKVEITYQDLHSRADALATRITNAGRFHTQKHFIVPLLLTQCPELYISQLAILKAGGAFCPLPIDAPQDRLSFILKDVDARIVLTTSTLRSRLPDDRSITIIHVDEVEYPSPTEQHRSITSKDIAYVMYTSGSTGLPKGVLLSHSSTVQALLAHDQHIPAFSRFLQFAAPTFDVSVFEIFFTLFRGRTIICCERTQLLSDLPGTINALDIDAAELTPSVASNLLGPRESVPGLRVLLTIGEMLKKDVVERWGGGSDRTAVLQGMYGPTEATIHCTLQPNFGRDMKVGNIGIPLDTVSAFIVRPATEEDSALHVLPLGEEGELAVGGYQLADGYLNRDEQTKAAFQTHPEYGKLYRTGDRASMTEDGRITCSGRISGGQVKLRGQRMELGEVEYAVAKTPGITGVVAEVTSDVLVAFCKCDPDVISEDEIRAVCRKWLPAYMLPTAFVRQTHLPYLPSGKIDRRALREAYVERHSADFVEELPSEDEQIDTLTKIVRRILGEHAVRGKDLLVPGIDSLTSIRVVSELSRLGFARPRATQIMTAKSIYDLSDILNGARASSQNPTSTASQLIARERREEALQHPLIRHQTGSIDKVLPCSAVQSAMLALTVTNPRFYCNWIKLEISTSYSNDVVESAIRTLVSKYELLRAGFLASSGQSTGYDVVIFKQAQAQQVLWTTDLQHDHNKITEEDLLRPGLVRLFRTESSVEILFQLHHALYDQWSIDLLKHDLSKLLRHGTIVTAPFSAILEYYIDNVEVGLADGALSFWSEHMKEAQPTTFPNTNSMKEESDQTRTAWQPLQIDQVSLRRFAAKHDCSMQVVFQTAYAYLLSQYVGSTDIVYGVVLSGRHIAAPGIDNAFGPTLTTLPVHLNVAPNSSWSHLISHIHTLTRNILEHSTTPIAEILKLSKLEPGATLFDTLFIWQESTMPGAGQDLVWEIDSADYHEFKLVAEVRPAHDHIESRLTYDTSVVTPQQAQQFLAQLEAVTTAIMADCEEPVAQIHTRLASSLLSIANPSPVYAASASDMLDDLEAVRNTNPELDALVVADSFDPFHTRSMTFDEMHRKANRLSRCLIDRGVRSNDLVALCMEKGLDFYVTILAIIKTGAGYLPMVPDVQPERASAILGQANVRVLISDEYATNLSQLVAVPVLLMSTLDLSGYQDSPPKVSTDPDHVAYTVFTSGSTGLPKGVTVTRANLHGNIRVLKDMYQHQPGDRLLQACLQSFDVAVFEIFFSFLAGLTICTARKDILFADLQQAIRHFGVTHLSMTPTVASLVQPDDVPTVKFLVTAGEAMTAAVHRSWAGRGLHQGYGPSETTNICTINMNITPQHHLGSIGPPFSNTSAFVLDSEQGFRILPQGAYGEFAFGGEQVFRGYVGLDKLNEEKIFDHPEYGRVYRSGDLGRILADGTLLIHGRSDFQVKIRGNRIELGEINATVLRSDAVQDCFTIVLTVDNTSAPNLVSFWTPQSTNTTTSVIIDPSVDISQSNNAIFTTLESSLPSYMVPTYLFPVTALPRTAQGKMDQRALNQLFTAASGQEKVAYSRSDDDDEETSERLPTEALITEVLASMYKLAVEDVNRAFRFDTFGVNSVNAISLAKTLSKTLDQSVQVSMILRYSTVARLARALEEYQPMPESKSISLDVFSHETIYSMLQSVSIREEDIQAILPCTPLQEAMLAAGAGNKQSYTNLTTFEVNGDIVRLKTCFQQAFKRHAILRTVFVDTRTNERPFAQVVLKTLPLPWTELDAGKEITGVMSVDSAHPIQLYVRRSDHKIKLHIGMHHAVYDGTSMSILLAEIEALYCDRAILPAPPADTFLDESLKQAGSKSREFWSSKLTGFSPELFPRPHAPAALPEVKHSRSLDVTTEDFQQFCKQHNVSITSIIHAAWARCLSFVQDCDDICFGDVASGRIPSIDGIDILVAPCFNTIPIRVDVSKSRSTADLVQRLHRYRKSIEPYQLAPLRMIQRLSSLPTERLFDSLILVQPPVETLDEHIWKLIDEQGGMGLPLVLEIVTQEQCYSITIHAIPAMIADIDIALLAELFNAALRDLLQLSSGTKTWQITSLKGALANRKNATSRLQTNVIGVKGHDWNVDELFVRRVLSELAKVEESRIRQNTSLYELGLDSLNAAQIATKMRSQGYHIDLADVLELRTPEAIAAAMLSTRRSTTSTSTSRLIDFDQSHRPIVLEQTKHCDAVLEAVRPCTPVQQGMLAQSLSSHGQLYVNHIWLSNTGSVSLDALSRAARKLQVKHPILRTGFMHGEESSSPFFMFICNATLAAFPALNFDDISQSELEAKIATEITASIQTPPWRVALVTNQQHTSIVWSLHHALYDAAGLHVLLTDFTAAIEDLDLGHSYVLDKVLLPILNAVSESESSCAQFWQSKLGTASATTFPSLTPTLVRGTKIDDMVSHSVLSASQLEKLCSSKKCTIQAAMQASWARLLQSYLGEQNVTFGTVLSSRSGADDHTIVFPCINTVPVNVPVQADEQGLLDYMVDYNAAVQRYRSTPLSDIQRYAGRPGEALFDTVIVYQRSSESIVEVMPTIERQSAAVDYKLSLELETTPTGRVDLRLSFASSTLPEEHASLMLKQYEAILLRLLCNEPGQSSNPEEGLSVTPPKQRVISSTFELLHHTVEQSAQQTPNRIALDFIWSIDSSPKTKSRWTYRELDRLGNKTAHLLLQHGAQKHDIIAVCMNKCPEASFAFLGILKAGCAFLAIDPDLPKARKEFILKDSYAKILLMDVSVESECLDTGTLSMVLSSSSLTNLSEEALPALELDPQSTCYCLYTSGTTGAPKGCEISHESAVQAMMSFQRLFDGHYTSKSRWLQFASYWFDVSVLEHFWSWSVGITMVGAPRDLVLGNMVEFINHAQISHIDLTPSLARLLEPEDVPCLCHGVFITGGEALKQEIIERWGKHGVICNGYGPTEATIGVTMNTFVGTDAKPANIGPAFDNVGTCVIDPDTLQPVLIGAIGELCVSGKLVGKGYLNRPDLTGAAFPVLKAIGQRVYRTGDLVRQLANGSFIFVGRKDSQAKLRGQRLEIDEIDSIIKASHSTIADVASLVVKSEDGNKQNLVSYIASEGSNQAEELAISRNEDASALVLHSFDACRQFLPGYMVPTHILPVSKIPLTVNNKTDAKALSAFYNNLSAEDLQSLRGVSNTKRALGTQGRQIASILAKMLSVDPNEIDCSSNIFSLGLSSVSVISFVKQLRRHGIDQANVAEVMRHPQMDQLVDALFEHNDTKTNNAELRQAQLEISSYHQRFRLEAARQLQMPVSSIETIVPCTPLQQGMLFESMKSAYRPYFNTFSFELHDVDANKLETSLEVLACKVEMLRVAFIDTDEGYLQVISKRRCWGLKRNQAQNQQCQPLTSELKQEWLEVNKDNLMRPFQPHLIMHSAGHVLIFQIHHAMYDGVSFDLLMQALAQIYAREEPDYGPAYTSVLPYGPLQQAHRSKEFWKQALHGFNFQQVERRQPTAERNDASTYKTGLRIDHLEDSRQRLGVSHQAMLQAAYQSALRQFSSTTTSYGVIISGRTIPVDGADRALGPLFNTLPCPIALSPGMTWRELVLACHEWNVACLPYQHTPLRLLKKWSGRSPMEEMFDTLFVLQIDQSTSSNTNKIWTQIEEEVHAEYPLAFEAELAPSGDIAITIVAQPKVAAEIDLSTFASRFETALQHIINHQDSYISDTFDLKTQNNWDNSKNRSKGMTSMNGVHDFAWSHKAKIIREELARLADLSVDDVDEHKTLFELGLDSIDTVKLSSRLRKQKIDIKVSMLLQMQTIPRMLSKLNEHDTGSNGQANEHLLADLETQLTQKLVLPGARINVERILPATPGQEALLAPMLQSNFSEYFNHDLLKIGKEIDIARLEEAWITVIKNSPILRTAFVSVDLPEVECAFAQVIHRTGHVSFETFELENSSRLSHLTDRIRQDVANSFETRPPLRLSLVILNKQPHLLLSIAHALYDGHSLALLHTDVMAAYHTFNPQRPSADAAINRALLATRGDSLNFWADVTTNVQPCQFIATNAKGDSSSVNRYELTSKVTTEQARAACRRLGISMQALAQSTWALVLAFYTRQLEVTFGIVLACRDGDEDEQIMFPTMNTVPFHASLFGNRQDTLTAVQRFSNEMAPHKQTPLRLINAAYRKHNPGHTKDLFDTLFIYQQRPQSTTQDREPLYVSTAAASSVDYPVAAEMEADGDKFILRAAVRNNVLLHEDTKLLVERLDQVLQSLLAKPDQPAVKFEEDRVSVCGLPAFEQVQRHTIEEVPATEISPEISSLDSDAVRDVLAKVSGISAPDIMPESSLESLGIDSISAIKVSTLLKKAGIKIRVSDMLKAGSVNKIAALTRRTRDRESDVTQAASELITQLLSPSDLPAGFVRSYGDIERIIPATAGQTYMLSVWTKTRGRLFYPTFTYQLHGRVSVERMRQAWEVLVTTHSILRTIFTTTGHSDHPIAQVVLKKIKHSTFVCNGVHSRNQQPFVRLHVVKQQDGCQLKLKIHHGLYDAVSLELMVDDLSRLINEEQISASPVSLVDYMSQFLHNTTARSSKDFWCQYLAGVSAWSLPADDRQPTRRVEIYQPSVLPDAVALEHQARKHNLSLQSLIFAAWAKVYATHCSKHVNTQKQDVVLGIYMSNRSHLEGLLELRAPTLNLVPLVIRRALDTTLLLLAGQVQRDLARIGSVELSTTYLWQIVRWTGVQIDTFLNFVKLPDSRDRHQDDEGDVTIASLDDSREEERCELVPVHHDKDFMPPDTLRNMPGWIEAYKDTLDIEMSVAHGTLDVGLFALESLIDLEAAQGLLQGLKSRLLDGVD